MKRFKLWFSEATNTGCRMRYWLNEDEQALVNNENFWRWLEVAQGRQSFHNFFAHMIFVPPYIIFLYFLRWLET